MELDHLRPKKYPEYHHLINDPHNLVLACGGCNTLKSDHWPALGEADTFCDQEGFLDPFEQDRREYFEVHSNGEIVALKPPAQYMIVLLALNRSSRKRIRELRCLKQRWISEFERKINHVAEMLKWPNLTEDQRVSLSAHRDDLSTLEDEIAAQLFDFTLY